MEAAEGGGRPDLPEPDFSYEGFVEEARRRAAAEGGAPTAEEAEGGGGGPGGTAAPAGPVKTGAGEAPKEEAGEGKAGGEGKVPVPFPPTPPEKLPGAARKGKKKKGGVRLVVRCAVCGTRHDASGKAPGDRIRCVCGKRIRITAPKKKKGRREEAAGDDPESILKRKALRSEDVDVLEGDD